jgi:hypothetical protein
LCLSPNDILVYYSKFSSPDTAQIDMFAEGIAPGKLDTLFRHGTRECKPNNLFNTGEVLNFNQPSTGRFIGESCCLLIDREEELQMLVLKKCAQLEADIIRVQCQTSDVPHPLELLDDDIWACVAVGTHESVHSRFCDADLEFFSYARGFPRLYLLSFVGRFTVFTVSNEVIEEKIATHSSLSDHLSDSLVPKFFEPVKVITTVLLTKKAVKEFLNVVDPSLSLKDYIETLIRVETVCFDS